MGLLELIKQDSIDLNRDILECKLENVATNLVSEKIFK